MDRPKSIPGILTLDTTTNTKLCNISLSIPQQTIYLTAYRVQMDSAINSLGARLLYIDLPILGGNQTLDLNVGRIYLPIMLDETRVTVQTGLNIPIYMSGVLPETFNMRVLNTSFAPTANLDSCTLQFSLSAGHTA